jgi:hypothetical protein
MLLSFNTVYKHGGIKAAHIKKKHKINQKAEQLDPMNFLVVLHQ